MLSKLVITILPRSKHLLISWLQSPSAVILEPPIIKSTTVSTVSLSICHEVRGLDAMILVFWMLSFKPTLSFSTFTFIKRLFSSSSLSAIRVESSVYLRLLIFLPEVLISGCASSSPVFLMMYSAYKLNKQGDNIQPWRTPPPIWNYSVVILEWIAIPFSRGSFCPRDQTQVSCITGSFYLLSHHGSPYIYSGVLLYSSSWSFSTFDLLILFRIFSLLCLIEGLPSVPGRWYKAMEQTW